MFNSTINLTHAIPCVIQSTWQIRMVKKKTEIIDVGKDGCCNVPSSLSVIDMGNKGDRQTHTHTHTYTVVMS